MRRGRQNLEGRPGTVADRRGRYFEEGGAARRSDRRWLRGRNISGVRRLSSSSPSIDDLSIPLISGDGLHPSLSVLTGN
jgi:hypothetical protein